MVVGHQVGLLLSHVPFISLQAVIFFNFFSQTSSLWIIINFFVYQHAFAFPPNNYAI